MLASLLIAAALTATPPAQGGEGALTRIENATVIQVSPRPAAGSGVFAIYADFEVRTEARERLRLYVLWMGGRQYLPDVGAVCTIVYRREPLARGNLHNPPARRGHAEGPLNVVHELSCGPPPGLSRPTLLSRLAVPDPISGPSDPGFLPWAQVVRVSPRPTVGSGIAMVITDFDVRTRAGDTFTMNMIYFGEDQFIPPVGSSCTIKFRPGGSRADSGVVARNMVDWLSCDTGTSSSYGRSGS